MDSTIQVITTAIAIYGAVLASTSLAISIWLGRAELNRHKPKLKVTPTEGVLVDAGGNNSEHFALIEAVNTGEGTIHITGVGWLVRGRKKHQFIRPYMLNLPLDLAERRKATLYYACRWLREYKDNERIVGAYFHDETGNDWKCRISGRTLRRWRSRTSDGWLIQWDPRSSRYYRQDRPGSPRIPLPG